MSKSARAALAGVAVAFGLGAAINLLFAAAGARSPGAVGWVLPMVIGTVVWTTMSRLAGNRAERRVEAGAVALTPPPGAALLVITREGFAGKAVGLDVRVDGRPAAQLRSPRATVLRVAPGEHDVVARNPQGANKGSSGSLRVRVAAGEVAFVTLRFAMGLTDGVVTLERAADPALARATFAKLTVVAPEPEWDAAV